MLRTLSGSLLLLTALAVSSCISPPDFPSTPNIEFKELKVTRITDPNPNIVPQDQVAVTVSFQDGEGDLGLTNDQKTKGSPYYQDPQQGAPRNRNFYNYFITIFRQNGQGRFEPVPLVDPRFPYDSTFPPLDPEGGKAAPLKGDLTFTTNFDIDTDKPIKPGDIIRFEISIMDRALNESNKITTTSYLVQP
ncbi:hypothetical protein [Hymenobacter fastidiosus]